MANLYRRGKTWYIRFQKAGREIRESSGSTVKADALRLLRQRQEEYDRLAKGQLPSCTFDDAMTRFIEEHIQRNLKPTAAYRFLVSGRILTRQFGGITLAEIDRRAVADFVSARRKDVVGATVRRDLACLSGMFSHAIGWGWADKNPVRDMTDTQKRAIRESQPRQRFASKDEYRAILKHAPKWLRPIIIVATETGMRLGEVLGLEWEDISWHRGEIRILENKTDNPRTVPLNAKAAAALSAQKPAHGLVFRNGSRQYVVTSISHAFAKVTKAAGIKDFRFHDLRHTFASWKVQEGMDLYRLQRILGHKGPQMTQRYAHLRTADLHEAMGTKPGTAQRIFDRKAAEKS